MANTKKTNNKTNTNKTAGKTAPKKKTTTVPKKVVKTAAPKKTEIKEEKKVVVKEEKVVVKETAVETEKSNNTMRNGLIIALILIAVICISILASNNSDKTGNYSNVNDPEQTNTTSGSDAEAESADIEANKKDQQKDHTSIDINKYLELKKGSDLAVIYIARPTCHYCGIQGPILKYVAYQNDITVNYLNTDEMTDEDSTTLIRSDDYFSEGYGTPLILVVKEDKIVGKLEGLTDTENMTNFFKEYKVIE